MSAVARSALVVWLVLMLSTAASAWGFSQPMFAPAVCTVAVMLISALKVGLVMSHFMELRDAPRAWQALGASWIAVAGGAVMFIYLR